MEIPLRFSKHRKTIMRLRSSDRVFRELWGNYLEIIESVQAQELDDPSEIELERLRASLEAEIYEALGNQQRGGSRG